MASKDDIDMLKTMKYAKRRSSAPTVAVISSADVVRLNRLFEQTKRKQAHMQRQRHVDSKDEVELGESGEKGG